MLTDDRLRLSNLGGLMKVVIPGGSGQLGTILARHYSSQGYEVVVLSRHPKAAPWTVAAWDALSLGDWCQHLEGADWVINLAGRSVNCRYNEANKRTIMDSRVQTTELIGLAISQAQKPPGLWLQASTATIYPHSYEQANTESCAWTQKTPGTEDSWAFSVEVASRWEQAVDKHPTPMTRTVKMRSSMVMSPDRGGVFDTLLGLVRWYLGGQAGDGRQFISWIHGDDFVRALDWIAAHKELSGPVNITAPEPMPNKDFMRHLRTAWGAAFGLPASRWMLEIGAFFMRSQTELVLKSRRVIPSKLADSGFEFHYEKWPEAAKDLCQRWRRGLT